MKKISDVMNTDVITVSKETTVTDLLSTMKGKKIGKIPVVESGKILGVVTRDDLLVREETPPKQPVIEFWDLLVTLPGDQKYEEKLKKFSGYSAEQIMTDKFFTCSPEDEVEKVVTEMLENGHVYALVIENEKLVGILTKSDLIEKSF